MTLYISFEIYSETVEKPKKRVLSASKYLILVHANFTKMQELDFFDSLAIYMHFWLFVKNTDNVNVSKQL